jgi:hypothetical protein
MGTQIVDKQRARELNMKGLTRNVLSLLYIAIFCLYPQLKNSSEISMRYNFTIFADYFQVYVADETMGLQYYDMWTETAYFEERVAVASGMIGISTVRNMNVPVEVEVRESQPIDPFQEWDQVVDCSIETRSGKLAVGGPGLDDDVPPITVEPGTYRARIFFGRLDTLSSDGTEGDDRYRIVLWPGKITPVTILKKHTPKAQ